MAESEKHNTSIISNIGCTNNYIVKTIAAYVAKTTDRGIAITGPNIGINPKTILAIQFNRLFGHNLHARSPKAQQVLWQTSINMVVSKIGSS